MQNVSLSPVMKRVCPTVASSFVSHAAVLPNAADPVSASSARHQNQVHAVGSALSCDMNETTYTVFLASVLARLAPVLGLLLMLWGSIAWSAGWLGALGG
ncbi:hypothetical protein W822_09800 [Advenella kashmirensis W13003]|uniref:Uncharacterized protein n=1 Tax=Advenella kashmirensis W13003 TaxID=1424334 RepID=V8QV50_9BURK|nr:hypothetical protein [Advenella kashmirensis]ETF03507.1 hypothetical protein W822_09800 [Advenella kashmirensis W13003]